MAFKFDFFAAPPDSVKADEAGASAAAHSAPVAPCELEYAPLSEFTSAMHHVTDVMDNVGIDPAKDIVTLPLEKQPADASVRVQYFSLAFLQRAIAFVHHQRQQAAASKAAKKNKSGAKKSKAKQQQQPQQQEEEDDDGDEQKPWWSSESGADIIPNTYLGGLKIWSCTLDVVSVVQNKLVPRLVAPQAPSAGAAAADEADWISKVVSRLPRSRLSVADIGCGHGLIGCALLKSAAALAGSGAPVVEKILFHDFNEEIATTCVAGTLRLNMTPANAAALERVRAVSCFGDWDAFALPPEELVDLVVAADVSYDDAAAAAFMRLLDRVLKPRTGVAVVGTKQFYFGTNGGAESLLKHCAPPLRLLCESESIGGESDMLRRIMCFARD